MFPRKTLDLGAKVKADTVIQDQQQKGNLPALKQVWEELLMVYFLRRCHLFEHKLFGWLQNKLLRLKLPA